MAFLVLTWCAGTRSLDPSRTVGPQGPAVTRDPNKSADGGRDRTRTGPLTPTERHALDRASGPLPRCHAGQTPRKLCGSLAGRLDDSRLASRVAKWKDAWSRPFLRKRRSETHTHTHTLQLLNRGCHGPGKRPQSKKSWRRPGGEYHGTKKQRIETHGTHWHRFLSPPSCDAQHGQRIACCRPVVLLPELVTHDPRARMQRVVEARPSTLTRDPSGCLAWENKITKTSGVPDTLRERIGGCLRQALVSCTPGTH